MLCCKGSLASHETREQGGLIEISERMGERGETVGTDVNSCEGRCHCHRQEWAKISRVILQSVRAGDDIVSVVPHTLDPLFAYVSISE